MGPNLASIEDEAAVFCWNPPEMQEFLQQHAVQRCLDEAESGDRLAHPSPLPHTGAFVTDPPVL